MKKVYEKPRMMFEDMEFYSAIAGCNVVLDGNGDPLYVIEIDSGIKLLTNLDVCMLLPENIICFHNPDGGYDGMIHTSS